MRIRQKKGVIALIVITLIFFAAAVFSFSNNKKFTAYAADNDVKYTITVEGNGSITAIVNKNETLFTEEDGESTMPSAFGAEINFYAQKYYQFSAKVQWSENDVIKINGANESSQVYEIEDVSKLSIQTINADVKNITITFSLKEAVYDISYIAKYIENSNLSDENTNAGGVVTLDKTKVKLNDVVEIDMKDEGSGQRFFDYALWNKQGYYEFSKDTKVIVDSKITISNDFLDKYLLTEGKIVVVGAFLKTFSVNVIDYLDNANPGNFIEIDISNDFTGYSEKLKTKSEIENYFSKGFVDLDEGSQIKVTKKDVSYFDFVKFIQKKGDASSDILDSECVITYLKANYEITAYFKKKEYSIDVDCWDNFKKLIGVGLSNGKFSIGDEITIELPEGLIADLRAQGYYDNYFTIKEGALQKFIKLSDISGVEITYTESMVKITINSTFLENFLNEIGQSGSIKIIANFSIKYKFAIVLNGANNLGSYTVSINNGKAVEYKGNYNVTPFNFDTVITIVLQPSKYAEFTLGKVFTASEQKDNKITIVLNYSDRDIVISFMYAKFSIKDKNEGTNGYKITANTSDGLLENLSIGSVITITSEMTDNFRVKSWLINGKLDVLKDLSLYDATYTDGTLKIVVNEKWLEDFGYNITNKIETEPKPMELSTIMMIAVPSTAAPILIIVLLVIFIVNSKRKKFIKAELLDEKKTAYTYNTGSMIEDLRDDTYNKITEEEIKAEMKKRKDYKDE